MKKYYSALLIFVFVIFCSCNTPSKKESPEEGFGKFGMIDSIVNQIHEPEFLDKTYSITDFGGAGDGKTDNKPALDSAIEMCSKNGGGKIVIPEGVFFVKGPVHLKSNINLVLSENSKLVFSNNPADYLPVVLTSWEGTRLYNYSPFIYAFNQKNIAITGKGEIDGEASETWQEWKKIQNDDKLLSRKMNNENVPLEERIFGEGHFLRPHLIQFYECENILIDGIKITDSPFWCIHPLYSKNIIVRNVKYDAQNLNNDGVDPESSENVLIENIEFNNHDDNIAIKSGRDLEARTLNRPSKNIVVRNCSFAGYNAFAIGSEMSGGVNHVFVENCTFGGNVIYGIYLKGNLDRGGSVNNIYVRNVTFDATESAILIDSDYKNEGSCCPPEFRDVYIEKINCSSTRDFGISLIGSEKLPLKNIQIKDVTILNAAKTVHLLHTSDVIFENVNINSKDFSQPKSE